MTLQCFLRTMMIALFGAAALAIATQARAEGGEGSSVIPPSQFGADAGAIEGDSASAGDGVDEVPAATASIPVGPKAKLKIVDDGRAGALRPLVARYASEHGLPFALADAVIRLESRYNPGVRNGSNMGLTQINVRTAQSLGYEGGAAGLLDAETNLRYGLRYLAEAYRLAGGDACGTILRFQFGYRAQTMTRGSHAYCAKVKTLVAKAE